MDELYPTVREAFYAGRVHGSEDAFDTALFQASCVSTTCETDGDVKGFHAAEEVCRRIKSMKERNRVVMDYDHNRPNVN